MGVQGLWSLVGPAARPVQLESLRQKRIAVDASIWIHQFMRTMRDKEGNALRNGHLLGFFRRICKLLFFDIKPVFVFDGGAPALKRSTIRERRKRREGIKANLKVTARKILSAQVKSRVLYQEEKKLRGEQASEAAKDEDFVYVDQLETSAAIETLRKKRKLDQFELPELESHEANISKLDPRLSTKEEIRDFVKEFDPEQLDIDSEEFLALPPEVQYEVLQDLMWRSRSTSWSRLDEMVRGSETAMDFSKQQIRLLKHRHIMTERVIKVNNASSGSFAEPTRIAGERGRQYVLYKNEDISQGLGWRLPGLTAEEPMNLDPTATTKDKPKRAEPKLEVPERSAFYESKKSEEPSEKPVDKVAAAMASNPKLAALFENILSDDEDEEEEMEEIIPEEVVKDNQPLFEKSSAEQDIVDDMGAYVIDDDDNADAINQVISRIYGDNSSETFEEVVPETLEQDINTLSADDFYNLWVSRVPDAFMYLHSFNDEYKKILKKAIDQTDPEAISKSLMSVRKQFGKTNEGDELALEALKFNETFLEAVYSWRLAQNEMIQQRIQLPSPEATLQNIMIEDDDDDEEIQFIGTGVSSDQQPVKLSKKDDDEQDTKTIDTAENNSVHINIQQSSLLSNAENRVNIEASNSATSSEHYIEEETATSLEEQEQEQEQDLMQIESDVQPTTVEDQGYNSEEETPDIQSEEHEYARFVSDIAAKHLDQVRSELYEDMKDLHKQQRKDLGNSDDITEQMVRDIQELLKLFGIPYLVSPMEAEAQCATLEQLNLVDGTITDDSDVFLFGASRVYKNMFNQQRYVECYMTGDIEREMLLTRKKLIQLAFLLGSDYTEGIPGVGPVAAMEILAEFSDATDENEALEAPLEKFKAWYDGNVDTTPFQKKFRKRHNALDIPDDFPNPLVIEAYYRPTVDESSQKFEWGQPQLDSLRIFLIEGFGWSEEKADQVLLPVLREMNSRKVNGEQATIGSFFNVAGTVSSGSSGPATKHSSKRVQSIVDNWRKQKKSKKN